MTAPLQLPPHNPLVQVRVTHRLSVSLPPLSRQSLDGLPADLDGQSSTTNMGDQDAGEDRCCQQPSRHPISMPQGLGLHSPIERFDNEARSPQTHSPLSRGATEQPPHSLPKRFPLHSSSAGHTGPRHGNNHTLLATSSSGIPLRPPTSASQSPDYWQEAESAYSRIGPGRGGDERGGGDEHVHTGGGLREFGLSRIVNWSKTTNPRDGDGELVAPVH